MSRGTSSSRTDDRRRHAVDVPKVRTDNHCPSGEAERLLLLSADWLWESDGHHRISWLSPGFAERISLAPLSVLGRVRLSSLVEPHLLLPDEAGLPSPFRDAACTFRGGDGRLRHVLLSGVPRFDADRQFLGYRGTGRVCPEAARAQDAAVEWPFELAATLPAPIFIKSDDLRFSLVNTACGALFGKHPDVLVGRRVSDLLPPPVAHRLESAEQAVLVTGVPCSLPIPTFSQTGRLHLSRLRLRRAQFALVGCFLEASGSQQATNSPADGHQSRRVLVVHRDADFRCCLSRQFAFRGLDGCAAGNATEALAVLKAAALAGRPADCIFIDEGLPPDQLASIIRLSPQVAPTALVTMAEAHSVDQVFSTIGAAVSPKLDPLDPASRLVTPQKALIIDSI